MIGCADPWATANIDSLFISRLTRGSTATKNKQSRIALKKKIMRKWSKKNEKEDRKNYQRATDY